jgi:L-lactate dehydrogenase complex protein LldE
MSGTEAPRLLPERGATVHLMLTCLGDAFYPAAGEAAVACLEHLGYRVAFDERQTCCGQPAFNSGDHASALPVARHTLEVFEGAEHLIVPSGSCAAMVRWGYPQLFAGGGDLERARGMAARTWELSEFLSRASGGKWPGALRRRVAFHRSCHMRELSAGADPEGLLRSVDGVEVTTLRTPEQCCGFGGTFTVGFPWISGEMAGEKWDDLMGAEPEEILTSDMGCLMHLEGYRRKQGEEEKAPRRAIPFRHFAELLHESLG